MKKYLPILLIILTIITAVLALLIGSVRIPLINIITLTLEENQWKILFTLRLPRIVMAILVGMMLASGGAVVQTIFQNPLADPYIIGISASATFGAVIASLLNLPEFFYGLFAFICCIFSTLTIFKIAKKGVSVNVATLLIVGIAVSAFLGSFTSFAFYLIGQDGTYRVTMWLMGNLSNATWFKASMIVVPLIFSTIYFFMQRHNFDALLSGDEEAHSIGIDVQKLKVRTLIVVALVVAFSVAFTGMIGFVGLIIPHIMRSLVGASNTKLLPSATIGGGLFLLLSDTVGRVIFSPIEIPIGIITSFIGAPFFLYLAMKSKR